MFQSWITEQLLQQFFLCVMGCIPPSPWSVTYLPVLSKPSAWDLSLLPFDCFLCYFLLIWKSLVLIEISRSTILAPSLFSLSVLYVLPKFTTTSKMILYTCVCLGLLRRISCGMVMPGINIMLTDLHINTMCRLVFTHTYKGTWIKCVCVCVESLRVPWNS